MVLMIDLVAGVFGLPGGFRPVVLGAIDGWGIFWIAVGMFFVWGIILGPLQGNVERRYRNSDKRHEYVDKTEVWAQRTLGADKHLYDEYSSDGRTSSNHETNHDVRVGVMNPPQRIKQHVPGAEYKRINLDVSERLLEKIREIQKQQKNKL
ncbi:MAG: hypothetical protein Q4C71_06325 [Microbacteriaceae bacterium]|nr:hypothetical protein [Microbacteriaceae bacterium]